jgi:hypothetical protein
VAGLVYDDANGNGKQDGQEKGVAGATIKLEPAQPHPQALASSTVVRTTTTGSVGHYRLDNLVPTDYTVTVTPPSGYQTHGSNQETVSVFKGKTATVPAFTLQAKPGQGATLYLPVMQKP